QLPLYIMSSVTARNPFAAPTPITIAGRTVDIFRLDALERAGIGRVSQLPFSLKVLLENLLRCEDDLTVTADDVRALAAWDPKQQSDTEIAFRPARVLLQDFTGVPCVVDLAAMPDAIIALSGHPQRLNPLQPARLVPAQCPRAAASAHTTRTNGLGVVGGGVGGIEAEAAMLGQPMPMLLPEVIGFKLTGRLREGATATDLVLMVTQMLRAKGVV